MACKHKFFPMTGKCFKCGYFCPGECTLQEPMKLPKGKYGVFRITRLCLHQGAWEVRLQTENKSKWAPYSDRDEAITRCIKENKKRVK